MSQIKIFVILLLVSLSADASDLYEVNRDGKCGCQDDFLSLIIPMDFYYIDCGSSGLYPVLDDQGWFYYNLKTKSLENPGDYLFLSKFVANTALAYTLDSVFVLDEEFNRLFGSRRTELRRLETSDFFVRSIRDYNVIIDRNGKRVKEYVGNDFIKRGKYLLIYGTNHFPYYRGDSVNNYVYEETLVNFENGDTLYPTNTFDNFDFLSDDIIVARKDNGRRYIYFVTNLATNKVIYESKVDEYLEFPVAKDYNLFKAINHSSGAESIYDFEGNLVFDNEFNDAVYIPEVDLILTDADFKSYLIKPSGDTLYQFEDWVLTRNYDFTFQDHRNNVYDGKLLVTIDSSICLFDPSNKQLLKLDYLTYENIMYTSIGWAYQHYLLLAEDVSLNDSLSNLGIYYLYRIYDLKNQEFYSEIFTDYNEVNDGVIRMENQDKVSYFEFKQYLKTSSYFKSGKIRKSIFPYKQILPNTVVDSSNTNKAGRTLGYVVEIDSAADYVYRQTYEGYLVRVKNLTGQDQAVNTQDGRIYLRTEVLYEDEWLPIDYMRSSWCGNSYFNETIKNGSSWEVIMPKYTGYKRGTLRIRFTIKDSDQEQNYYSKQFQGSYNKSQLLDLENIE